MNITFSWKRDLDYYVPISKSDHFNNDGINLLDCLLMDNGGLPYLESVPWLEEGIKRGIAVAGGAIESSDWTRETWGVTLNNGEAKIYSLYENNYLQTISLKRFVKVLKAWMIFIQSQPNEWISETLNLD